MVWLVISYESLNTLKLIQNDGYFADELTFSNAIISHYLNQWWPCLHTLAANVMESILLNGIWVNLIGIYCFWSYVQFRNEMLLISSIHYVTNLNGQRQSALWTAETQEKEKSEFRGSHLKWSLPSHYHFDAFMQRGVSHKTIDIFLYF